MPTWAGLSCWYKKLTKANVLKPQKLFWFGGMAFVPVGPPLYCFIVSLARMFYRSTLRQKVPTRCQRSAFPTESSLPQWHVAAGPPETQPQFAPAAIACIPASLQLRAWGLVG